MYLWYSFCKHTAGVFSSACMHISRGTILTHIQDKQEVTAEKQATYGVLAQQGQPCICNSKIHGYCTRFVRETTDVELSRGELQSVPKIECLAKGVIYPLSHCTGYTSVFKTALAS